MKEFVIFEANDTWFALPIENVFRIIMPQTPTPLPKAHPYLEGMIDYEHKIYKVVNFRQLIGRERFDSELTEMFEDLKKQHVEWVEALRESVIKSIAFTKSTSADECNLGIWLHSFNSYDDYVISIMKELKKHHSQLHKLALTVLEYAKKDTQKALNSIDSLVQEQFNITMNFLEKFMQKLPLIADSLQKLLIIVNEGKTFALKVDKIIDIDRIDDEKINTELDKQQVNDTLELYGIIEFKERLVSIVRDISVPHNY